MEVVLGVPILILFLLILSVRSRVATLETQLASLQKADTAQKADIQSLWQDVTRLRNDLITEKAGQAHVHSSLVVAQPYVPPEEVVSPSPSTDLLADLLEEVAPELAAVSAARVVAQRAPRGASLMERALRKLRGTEEWEALIGGRLLNRIGAVAVILSAAFFFKYAVDQNWISQGMRVAAGLLVGAILLTIAHRSHQRGYAIFGQGLVVAGQAVMYLSVYASFNFYHLVPQPVALVVVGGIVILGFVQGVYYDSLAVSLLACTGGYLTPFLLDSGGSPVGTVAFVFMLDVSVLAVLVRKPRWIVLEPIALVATYVTYYSWYLTSYSTNMMAMAAFSLTIFWALFLSFDLYGMMTARESKSDIQHTLGVLNGAAFYGGLFALIGPAHHTVMSFLTLVIGTTYVAALLAIKRRGQISIATVERYALTAEVLLIVATAIQFRGFVVVCLWSLEAVPLVWFGIRWKLWYVWRPGLVVFALATGVLFATAGALLSVSADTFVPLFNLRDLAFLVMIGALAASTVPFRRSQQSWGEIIEVSMQSGWMILTFILLAIETNDLFRRFMVGVGTETLSSLQFQRSLAVSVVWMVFSLSLAWFGTQKRYVPWIAGSLGSAAAATGLGALVGIAYEPIQRFVPIINIRVAVFAFLIGSLSLHLRWLTRNEEELWWMNRVVLQAIILLLGFELFTAEINDYFQQHMGHPLTSMDTGGAFIELAILASIWMLYSLLPTWYGVRKRTMPLISLGLSMGAAATGIAAVAGIVFQPSKEFALMLGVRPIILAILVAGLLIQMRWFRESGPTYRWTGTVLIAIEVAIILLGFGIISAETRDAFAQRLTGAGINSASTLRDLERLAFSMVWLVYGIVVMGLGIWRRVRWMRLGALVLFAVVIVKVFVYDLSFLGAVYRPISFAGLGIILLAVSYLYQRYRTLLLDAG